ncbi:hypothetical protein LXA43DRAFT_881901, partial [Ganoderma leucocontextum]
KFTRGSDFSLDGGDLILLAGETAFCVCQGLLTKRSVVFADIFATGSIMRPSCLTVVQSPPPRPSGNHPEDLGDFLQYLMPCSELRLRDGLPVSDFSELHTPIHPAHSYQCPDVEPRTLSILKQFYTAHFSDYARFDATNSSIIPRCAVLPLPPPSSSHA